MSWGVKRATTSELAPVRTPKWRRARSLTAAKRAARCIVEGGVFGFPQAVNTVPFPLPAWPPRLRRIPIPKHGHKDTR